MGANEFVKGGVANSDNLQPITAMTKRLKATSVQIQPHIHQAATAVTVSSGHQITGPITLRCFFDEGCRG
jgi:hypothetical protein